VSLRFCVLPLSGYATLCKSGCNTAHKRHSVLSETVPSTKVFRRDCGNCRLTINSNACFDGHLVGWRP
jgi:hypothetical protein